ncbi:MAG: hypothetical protein MJH10_14810 [Epibacterium sp.]|jgi:hypothetical protein|nr:hypothetical protein [Epibacterium sp.]NQX74793.1 hypothetical protein [Epibacterium sp.]
MDASKRVTSTAGCSKLRVGVAQPLRQNITGLGAKVEVEFLPQIAYAM